MFGEAAHRFLKVAAHRLHQVGRFWESSLCVKWGEGEGNDQVYRYF